MTAHDADRDTARVREDTLGATLLHRGRTVELLAAVGAHRWLDTYIPLHSERLGLFMHYGISPENHLEDD